MDLKTRIIEEASVMFRTYGIRAVTMDMLAGSLGISKRTIYEVFRDKDELLHGVLGWMAVRQREMTSKILESSENVIEAIFSILDNMLEHYRRMSHAFRLDMKKYHNEMVRKLRDSNELPYNNIRIILLRGIDEGVFREDLDIEITNKCLSGVTRMTSEGEKIDIDTASEEMVRDFFINYLRGISTQKGLDLINFCEKRNKGI